jgi:hypothetical protein
VWRVATLAPRPCPASGAAGPRATPAHHSTALGPPPPPALRTCLRIFAGRSCSTSALRRRTITLHVSSRLSSSSFLLPTCRGMGGRARGRRVLSCLLCACSRLGDTAIRSERVCARIEACSGPVQGSVQGSLTHPCTLNTPPSKIDKKAKAAHVTASPACSTSRSCSSARSAPQTPFSSRARAAAAPAAA